MYIYKQLLLLVLPYWRRIVLAMCCMILVAASTAAGAYLVKPALDDIFMSKRAEMLTLISIALFAAFATKGACLCANAYLMSQVSQGVITRLRQGLYNHIQSLSLPCMDQAKTGNLMSCIINDVGAVQGALSESVTGIIKESFTVVFLLIVIFLRDWQLALAGSIILPLTLLPVIKFGRALRRTGRKYQLSMADLSVIIHETLTGNRIVKAFGMENYEKKRFGAENERIMKYTMKAVFYRGLNSGVLEGLGGIGVACAISFGGYRVIAGNDTPGNFFSLVTALFLIYDPVKRLSNMYVTIQQCLAAAARMYEVLSLPVEVVDRPDAMDLPPVKGHIEFRQVSFKYGNKYTLSDINFSVDAGQVVALVGMSGAGKTTLVNLIPSFYEITDGTILIDGIDIRSVKISSLRSQVAIVTQQTILFNDTIRNNIAYGDISKSDEEIKAAAKAANAYDFIVKMPQQFDTIIGEQGIRISGGERQRICIARAILKDAPILILDEATSALDSDSELEVQKALENLMKGRTTLIIAHRLSTIQSADKILTLADGRIIEQGRHNELMASDTEYRRLYQLQFAQFSQEDRGIAFSHS